MHSLPGIKVMADSDDEYGPTVPTADEVGTTLGTSAEDGTAVNEEDNYGPVPSANEEGRPTSRQRKKRRKVLAHADALLKSLPSGQMYEKSYMHKDEVTHICVSSTEFIVTASCDGQLKFWKKMNKGIEFVKEYRAHMGTIRSMVVSFNGQYVATCSNDRTIKVFHVATFDMIRMIRTKFEPSSMCWVYDDAAERPLLAVSDQESGRVAIFHTGANTDEPQRTVMLHGAPVTAMAYNRHATVVISADTDGIVEYWSPREEGNDGENLLPEGTVSFSFKGDTSLYAFAEAGALVHYIAVAPDGSFFATTSTDCIVRVFRFKSGKLARAYDETLAQADKVQKLDTTSNTYKLEALDFGRRMAVERQLHKAADRAHLSNVIFDESSKFLLYPSFLGIKVVNLVTNKVERLLGKVENTERFYAVALYQGRAKTNAYKVVTADTPDDPMLVCAAFNRKRFYLFTSREPDDEDASAATTRDVFNERPSLQDKLAAKPIVNPLGTSAVIHTTLGDIHLQLFPDECPKTVENFSTHSRANYYDGVIFHRVIRGFMVQTGDPQGDGTGGQSIWGHEFEDEIHRDLRHDRPFTVSSANAGPHTNGSQFFITTQPAQWLDGKHTVFGRVTKGMDVVTKIEKVKTDKFDRPYEPPRIINIDITE